MNHGIFILEEDTALTTPKTVSASVPVVIGTAPVNMAPDPESKVNVPILANSATEAMAKLGYSKDMWDYTLCQLMYATANIYQVSPAVYINVLDPARHKKPLAEKQYQVNQMQAVIQEQGVIADSLTVQDVTAGAGLTKDTDYTIEFSTDGSVVVTLIAGGAGETATVLSISGEKLDPSKVTMEDIIGSYDQATGRETGLQAIRQVFPKLGIVPGLILAPGWSQIPEVGLAMSAKAAVINGVFKAMALVDLDTEKATKYTDCKKVKEESGFTSPFCYPLWPCDRVGSLILAKSVTVAALTAYQDASNDDVPSRYPSNKMLGVTGQCLRDGTEVILDQDQGTTVNSYGVTTAINIDGWRLWGNYTGAYPSSGEARDIWFAVRRMFNWQGNTFIRTYFSKVDDPMNQVLIESVVDSENIRCAAYAPDKWAGASIEYRKADNTEADIMAGKITFRQKISPYTPAQEINNILSYDIETLKAVIGGEY